MKKRHILLIIAFVFICSTLNAQGNHYPVPKDGTLITNNDSDDQVYLYKTITLADIEIFYKHEFKETNDVNWNKTAGINGFILDDWGNKNWHKITVIDKGKEGIEITIQPDRWTWIIGTLIIRFIGVLIVLSALMIFIYISGYFFRMTSKKADA